MFNKKTLQVITALQPIADTAIFTYPITGIRDSASSIAAFIDMTKLDEEKFDSFGIYNIKSFIDIVKLVGDNTEIVLNNKILHIKSETMSCQYITSAPELIESIAKVEPERLKNVLEADLLYEFSLEKSSLETIKKASQILQLDTILVKGNESKVSLTADSSDNTTSNKFNIEVNAEVMSSETIAVNVAPLKKVPLTDYNCKVKQRQGREVFVLQLTPKDAPYITIIIPSKLHK